MTPAPHPSARIQPAPPPVQRNPLLLPVGSLCRSIDSLEVSASVRKASERFQEDDTHVLPVTRGGFLAGALEEKDLLFALSGDWESWESVERMMRRDPPVIHPAATGADALRTFESTRSSYLLVVDGLGRCYGVLTPSRLAVVPEARYRPRMVGGMATPFGVYLTNGKVGAGASPMALAATGGLLFGLFLIAAYASLALTAVLPAEIVRAPWYEGFSGVLSLALFLFGMRILPLSGIHAAEHKVVHAIEQGEDLEPAIVARMPRIHPRCGTNLAAGAMVFMGLLGWEWTDSLELRMLVAFLATLAVWRPLGSFLQQYATTKEPTPAQIEMGIRAGKALLKKLETAPAGAPSLLQRISSSGIIHIIAGSFAVQGLAAVILYLLNVPEAWRPF
jgi:hypothetical protein